MSGHYVEYGVRNESSVTLHDYVDLLRDAGKIAEEIRKKGKNDKRLACACDYSEDL